MELAREHAGYRYSLEYPLSRFFVDAQIHQRNRKCTWT